MNTSCSNFNLAKWLERLTDYVHIKSIQPVPANVNRYSLVKRYRADTNLQRLTRRFMNEKAKERVRKLALKKPVRCKISVLQRLII